MEHLLNAKNCPGCEAPLTTEAKFCSRCGYALDPGSPPAKPKWYYNVWFVLLMLFFVVGPFGLPLVWRNPRFSRGVKLALTAVMVLYTIALIHITVGAFRSVSNELKQFNATIQF